MKDFSMLQILPALNHGGVERGAIDLAIYLESQGIKNTIISTGGALDKTIKNTSVNRIYFDTKSKNPFTFLKRVRQLNKIIQDINPSLLHARSRIPAWLTYFANRSLKLPFITTFHGLHDNGLLGLKKYYNAGLIKSDIVIAVSDTVKHYLIKNFPCIEKKIVVIHRGIDCNYFLPEIIPPNAVPKIVLPGRITSWKGHEYFLKAFAKFIHDYKIKAELQIVGKAKNRTCLMKLKTLIKNKEIENFITFTGASNDMRSIYAQADLVISSSIEPESFGRVAVEAMAMEKLVIATNIGGSSETIIDGKTGWLVEPNNVDEMAKAIYYALSLSQEAREKIEKQARRHVLEHFTLEKMTSKTLAVYQNLIQKNHPA